MGKKKIKIKKNRSKDELSESMKDNKKQFIKSKRKAIVLSLFD